MAKNPAIETVLSTEKSLLETLVLLADEGEGRLRKAGDQTSRKAELLLSDVGLQPPEIASILGMKSNTVHRTVSAAKVRQSTEAREVK